MSQHQTLCEWTPAVTRHLPVLHKPQATSWPSIAWGWPTPAALWCVTSPKPWPGWGNLIRWGGT
jgi:hypothetical protein